MSHDFKICCVIPAYNREKFMVDALDSVAAQTRRPDETIVVDDGSTDATVEVVRQWQQSHDLPLRLIQQANGGAASARNAAIRATEADLIAPLDSDDVWLPNHVEILESSFQRHPELVVCAGNTERLDDIPLFKRMAYGDELFERLEYDTDADGLRVIRGSAFVSLLRGAYIQTSSCMFRRSAACEVGLLDTSLRSYEDQLFFLRLSRLGRFGLYMQPVTLLRKHDDNTTHRRHIASHILCSIAALEKAMADADAMGLNENERDLLRGILHRKINGAADRSSRYGWKPYWQVVSRLARAGNLGATIQLRPLMRAALRPLGDQDKLQQRRSSQSPTMSGA